MRKVTLIKWTLTLGSLTVTAWQLPDIMDRVGKTMNPALAMGGKSAIGPDALSLLKGKAAAPTAESLKSPMAEDLVLFGGASLSDAQRAALLKEAARRAPANPPTNVPQFGGGKSSPVRTNEQPPSNSPMDGVSPASLEQLTRELEKIMPKGGG